MPHAYVALGANLGDRLASLRAAARRLGLSPATRVTRASAVYETAPIGPIRDQPAFLNAVVEVTTTLGPRALLDRLLAIEAALGRTRTVPQGPRTLDLDLLVHGDAIVAEPGLVVPHPRLATRAFVLVPFAEFAPELVVPGTGATVAALLARLAPAGVVRLAHADLVAGSGPAVDEDGPAPV
jgi:2-amino-4-hydroxy-6-hydroxymethyldihydropteridine diphosphokinase